MSDIGQLYRRISAGPILKEWHWLSYNFTPGTNGWLYFGILTLRALSEVDKFIPGYADIMITRLEKRGGREKNLDDYAAILAWLAELLVVLHLVQYRWKSPVSFEMEPVRGESRKNPELLVVLDGRGSLGVEVKCPNLLRLSGERRTNSRQLLARLDVDLDDLGAGITRPKDNKLKDCLESANSKFAGFRDDPDFRSVLVVVWDDYINEPISALLSPSSGLLTGNSYHRDASGKPITFQNVDGVLLMRHQHQFIRGMANLPPLDDRKHFLDLGEMGTFPPHVLVANPIGLPLGQHWVEALHAWPLEMLQHMAEYRPAEVVNWAEIP